MSHLAQVKAKTLSMPAAVYILPAALLVNTMVLFTLDLNSGIPGWIKLAATLFLSF